jgi:Fungal chitosanase of glycosyl hydrolase group 75
MLRLQGIREKRRSWRLTLLLCAALGLAGGHAQADSEKPVCIATVVTAKVLTQESPPVVLFTSGMQVDADGSPRAYHRDSAKALDFLANAGKQGNWWALATDNGQPSGQPVVQKASDPAPGYYVSMTSLQDRKLGQSDPRRYVDASQVPYIALPMSVVTAGKLKLGDIATVVNRANGKVVHAIFADVGPKDKIGEGSVYLANELHDKPISNPHAKGGGFANGIVYVVFVGSGDRKPKSREQIAEIGSRLFEKWGGLRAVEAAFPKTP